MNVATAIACNVCRRILAEHLRRWCSGTGHAAPKHRLRGELAAAGLVLSVRDLERMIQEAVLEGVPIGSSDKGFFWCQTPDDFDRARAYLVGRMVPQSARIKALERAKRDRFPDEPLFTEST